MKKRNKTHLRDLGAGKKLTQSQLRLASGGLPPEGTCTTGATNDPVSQTCSIDPMFD